MREGRSCTAGNSSTRCTAAPGGMAPPPAPPLGVRAAPPLGEDIPSTVGTRSEDEACCHQGDSVYKTLISSTVCDVRIMILMSNGLSRGQAKLENLKLPVRQLQPQRPGPGQT